MDRGLSIFQVLQTELLSRENNRSTLGIGFRLAIIEERVKNHEAKSKNNLAWRPQHAITPITALTPETKRVVEAERERLLKRRGANPLKDDKDPTMLIRHEEVWEVHPDFPRTVLEFKELQFRPDIVRSMLEFYAVKVYRPDLRPVTTNPDDRLVDVQRNLETCLEELAMAWGLNWFRIGGLTLPGQPNPFPNP
ncbi:hypothetical protein A1O1_01926 [Capronia coronata CBS 617.96]|uniref:Uncharacterized protein n=1 Tax=Capronia coronata CBS 617.96 TaxID=1182541 RepID=W9ZGB0_9EURO|nr:uncharacterized protein A1O1_01926 [Capronia coronata CBS 617.96]EXJ93534.1 hypothetical protein A1O1_01926 [Capronia coronata CBS 617.96]